ncbi:tyrosine-type recombinase/integrase [Massilia frigida]|uniref:tyrosine-type recombinase/integrase n=1 Tax=Massilia frigida TaxID=2609281 RepID=UPI0022773338|nr:tyrosine-type recombinase/integrase [Massilia frigida]
MALHLLQTALRDGELSADELKKNLYSILTLSGQFIPDCGKRVPANCIPSDMRHPPAHLATHLLEQKVDIRVIQVLQGHKKLDTTALYAQVATELLREVVSPLEAVR